MNAFRVQLRGLLQSTNCSRPPALRRSLRASFLYATDLPAVADRETVAVFLAACRSLGWTAEEKDGWVELDRPMCEPPAGWSSGPEDGEAACCLSLLRRHGTGKAHPEEAADAARILMKAGEAGGKAWQEACAGLHRDWASRLRRGEPLPPLSRRFLIEESNNRAAEKTGYATDETD